MQIVSDTAAESMLRRSMGSSLEPGIEATEEFVVEGRLLTDVGGTIGANVLSTPGMIAMMERTSSRLVYPWLDDGHATVGFEVCVKHVAAAPEGMRCEARSRLEDVVDGRKLRFSVEVVSAGDGRTIGVGTHERRIISSGR
jgi:fluoroacetyl-CoA thioesterase